PDRAAQAIVFRQARDREFDFARNTGIHGRAQIFAAVEARTEATTFETANELRAWRKGFHGMDGAAIEAVDHPGLAANAGHDARVLDERHEIARAGLGPEQVVIPADILLAEGGVDAFG